MSRVLVLLHGIRTDAEKEREWMEPCQDFMLKRGCDDVRILYYGDLTAFAVGFPIVGGWVLRSHVRKVQKFCKALRRELGADVEIDLLAHSYGTRLWWFSMQQDSRYPKTRWRRVVLMGSVVSSRVDFGTVAGHFLGLLNLRSLKDSVVAVNPFGQSGQEGFQFPESAHPPAEVEQVDMTPYTHGAFINPVIAGSTAGAWDVAAKYLAG